MKRMLLFAAALLGCATAFAQTMKVVEGPVTTLIPAATASDSLFRGAATVAVAISGSRPCGWRTGHRARGLF